MVTFKRMMLHYATTTPTYYFSDITFEAKLENLCVCICVCALSQIELILQCYFSVVLLES